MFMIRLISFMIILFSIILIIFVDLLSKKNNNTPKKNKKLESLAILIPARDESNVIEDLLISIKNQTHKVNMKDVYVIVESNKDKTVSICKKYNASIIIRKHLELKRKGYALDEAVKQILKDNKHYDVYFIFDADNILEKDFIKNMVNTYNDGYDMASGYRNCKNGNKSAIAAASALTFSLINTIFNDKKIRYTKNITFSGTGFYIKGDIIENLGGYPFHSLTEDYEISTYAVLNNLTTYYNKKAIFYDEQPIKYKDTINQRQRWIRGYFDVRRLYGKKIIKSVNKNDRNFGSKLDLLVGVLPYALMIIAIFIYLFGNIFNIVYRIINNQNYILLLYELSFILIIIYFILMIITFLILIKEKDSINLNKKIKIRTLFYNPIFVISYIPCAVKALTKKEIEWKKIKHGN